MRHVCWSVKGGSGTTVVATALALLAAQSVRRETNDPKRCDNDEVLLIDLGGDVPAVLGRAVAGTTGVLDWLHAADSLGHDALERLIVPISDRLSLLPSGDGSHHDVPAQRWLELASYVRRRSTVVVDLGVLQPDDGGFTLVAEAERSVFVTRNCYVGLRRAMHMQCRTDLIVLIHDSERSLNRFDLEAALGRPVDVQLALDPAIARAVDSGLFGSRLPRSLTRAVALLRDPPSFAGERARAAVRAHA